MGDGRSGQSPAPVSLMAQMSQPPPPLGQPASRSLSPPSIPSSPPVMSGKAARFEQLVKTMMATMPGIPEETISRSIMELRARHGKLSGWTKGSIATAIMELINESNFKSSFNT